MNAHALFVADVHLCESRPDASARFFDFLSHVASQAQALYILGDLFESWVGDDDLDAPLHQSVITHLSGLSARGVQVSFMHGNRDFMLAQHFARLCGMQLLADPVVVDLYGTPTLLTHGDAMCTADVDYQRYRRVVRHPWMMNLLGALPLRLRQTMAKRARAGSEQAKMHKSAAIMDVDAEAVVQLFSQYRVQRMIHGHTHRPAQHSIDIDGIAHERWVLPDWYDDRGGYVVCDAQACRLVI